MPVHVAISQTMFIALWNQSCLSDDDFYICALPHFSVSAMLSLPRWQDLGPVLRMNLRMVLRIDLESKNHS